MLGMIKKALRLAAAKEGVTAVEYGLIAGGIAVAIVGAVVAFGSPVTGIFARSGDQLKTVPTAH